MGKKKVIYQEISEPIDIYCKRFKLKKEKKEALICFFSIIDSLFKECSDFLSTMIVFTSLPNFISLCVLIVFYNAGVRQKKVFGHQDVFKRTIPWSCRNL